MFARTANCWAKLLSQLLKTLTKRIRLQVHLICSGIVIDLKKPSQRPVIRQFLPPSEAYRSNVIRNTSQQAVEELRMILIGQRGHLLCGNVCSPGLESWYRQSSF